MSLDRPGPFSEPAPVCIVTSVRGSCYRSSRVIEPFQKWEQVLENFISFRQFSNSPKAMSPMSLIR